MPLWRRRSRRPEDAPSGPPQLPNVASARQSMSLTTLRDMYAPAKDRDITSSDAHVETSQPGPQATARVATFPSDQGTNDTNTVQLPEGVDMPVNLPAGTQPPAPGTWSRSAGRTPVAVTGDVNYRPGSMRPTFSSPSLSSAAAMDDIVSSGHSRSNTTGANAARPVNYSRPTTPSNAKKSAPTAGSDGERVAMPTSPPQYHRPLGVSNNSISTAPAPQQVSPAKTGAAKATSAISPRKRDRGPPPSAFAASGYNMASDFRISPAAHAAAQPQPSPQARRTMVESARAKTLRKSRAPTRLNVMVVGEAATGKTIFLRSLLQSMLGAGGEDGMSDSEEPLATISGDAKDLLQSFGLNARGRPGRTKQIQTVEGIELVPDQDVLLSGLCDEEELAQSPQRPSLRRNASSNSVVPSTRGQRRQRRGSNTSRLSASMSFLGSAAPPNRLSLNLIDTPGLPSVLPQSTLNSAANGPTPAFLRPIVDEIVSRYVRTLKEETKLRRVPSKTSGGDSEHVHVVVWFVQPSEILEGGRTWWREEQERIRWERREQREKARQEAERKKVEQLRAAQEKDLELAQSQTQGLARDGGKAANAKPDGPQRRRTLSTPGRPSSATSLGSASQKSSSRLNRGSATANDGSTAGGTGGRKRANSLKGMFQDLKIGSADAPLPPRRSQAGQLTENKSAAASTDDATDVKTSDSNGGPNLAQSQAGQAADDPQAGHDGDFVDDDEDDESSYLPTLSPSQKIVLSHLLPLVPVLPIIARADGLTVHQLEAARRGVQRGWQEVVDGLEARQQKRGSKGSNPPTEQWGWIGFDNGGRPTTGGGEQPQTPYDDDTDDTAAVKLIRIKSRRSYSSNLHQVGGRNAPAGEETEQLRDSPMDDRRRDRDSLYSSSQQSHGSSAVEHTAPLFARPTHKRGPGRSGSQSSGGHVGEGAASTTHGHDDESEDDEEQFDPADPDPRLLLGVQDVVPSRAQMEGRWPLAIWTPDLPRANITPAVEAREKARAKRLNEAAAQLQGRTRGEGEEEDDTRFSMIPTGVGDEATATQAPSAPTHTKAQQTRHQPLPLTRTYPTGSSLHLLNPAHSDFLALKAMLLGTHTGVILETSKETFEGWRGETLEMQQRQKAEAEKLQRAGKQDVQARGVGDKGGLGMGKNGDGPWVVV
ncbi:hypothetical protein BDZ90DRAFT_230456 [Jaminaea rosea]|uniref:Septin-type G domain-containing protein n=1 Tax=Jaminaea rosea TaxID=1569628 RepID=A0A316UX89_9BASI|nr:hypothetical protein BDZ90DRAFT_230456 [Jaminaea rosea]PWN29594.1 hypothetical protein BDZ90DRAFT_230456 [Jaminaea rosea]